MAGSGGGLNEVAGEEAGRRWAVAEGAIVISEGGLFAAGKEKAAVVMPVVPKPTVPVVTVVVVGMEKKDGPVERDGSAKEKPEEEEEEEEAAVWLLAEGARVGIGAEPKAEVSGVVRGAGVAMGIVVAVVTMVEARVTEADPKMPGKGQQLWSHAGIFVVHTTLQDKVFFSKA